MTIDIAHLIDRLDNGNSFQLNTVLLINLDL